MKLKGAPKVIQVSAETFENDDASRELRVKGD
jgi:hypothetical protein